MGWRMEGNKIVTKLSVRCALFGVVVDGWSKKIFVVDFASAEILIGFENRVTIGGNATLAFPLYIYLV